MKALLLKDFLTLSRYLRMALLFVVIFACIPGGSMAAYALVFAAMIPITALAYDEQSKWPRLAAMMPYSPRQLVMSKYVLGYIMLGGAILLSVVSTAVTTLVRGDVLDPASLSMLLILACAASLILAVIMPLILRFGVEKGRLVMLVGVAVIVGITFVLGEDDGLMAAMDASPLVVLAVFLAVCVAVNALSIPLSVRIYSRKNRQ
ncbi:MAG: ABC-2 transporter permease [Eubacteriales bacterium]|nr:ABC-2 transporter permease [Eubacteriales bacterium]